MGLRGIDLALRSGLMWLRKGTNALDFVSTVMNIPVLQNCWAFGLFPSSDLKQRLES